MLRLVHPAREGQDPPRRKGRRSAALSLTAEEARQFRAALRNTGRAYGGYDVLAAVVGVPVATLRQALHKKSRRPSAGLALRVAQAAGMSVEAIIGSALNEAGRCAACGSRVGDRRAAS